MEETLLLTELVKEIDYHIKSTGAIMHHESDNLKDEFLQVNYETLVDKFFRSKYWSLSTTDGYSSFIFDLHGGKECNTLCLNTYGNEDWLQSQFAARGAVLGLVFVHQSGHIIYSQFYKNIEPQVWHTQIDFGHEVKVTGIDFLFGGKRGFYFEDADKPQIHLRLDYMCSKHNEEEIKSLNSGVSISHGQKSYLSTGVTLAPTALDNIESYLQIALNPQLSPTDKVDVLRWFKAREKDIRQNWDLLANATEVATIVSQNQTNLLLINQVAYLTTLSPLSEPPKTPQKSLKP